MSILKKIFDPTHKHNLVEIQLSGTIPEESVKISIPFINIKSKKTMLEIDVLFDYLKNSSIKAVVIVIKQLSIGLSRANQIRNNVLELTTSGVKTYAYLKNPGNIEYFIATAAENIFVSKWSTLNLIGLSSETFYLKKFFERVKIEPEFISKGNYKSAAEMFTRETISEYNIEMINSILDDNYNLFKSKISKSRNMELEQVSEIFDNGPYFSDEALEKKLVDGVCYYDEVKDKVERDLSVNIKSINEEKIIKYLKLRNSLTSLANKITRKKLTIAVVSVHGLITEGESRGGDKGLKTCGSYSLIRSLKKAEEDSSVCGVIIRVFSPGGSAQASDIIRNKIEKITKKKPVVVSMSDVAASGGYMLSLGANKIYADEFTITGSIGVISGKFNLSKLLEFFEINHYSISKGKHASIYSPLKKFSDDEMKQLDELIENMYNGFVELVSRSRKMDFDTTEKISQGRVWTGSQALKHNLIDNTGNINNAIEHILGELDIDDRSNVLLKSIDTKLDLLSSNLGKAYNFDLTDVRDVFNLFENEKVLALMPAYIKIK
ncbi:MAG: signal peptide peptidase SppA [Candidatus Dadabacteria bacterium]|nr:signal peptide peptidase SppA [Candidatus Dadabacteria bacterium]NIQ13853.1 signal peptide peptidase SppA [Candidatus Dadabacteria bacterium]